MIGVMDDALQSTLLQRHAERGQMAQQGVVRLLPCPNCGRYYPNPDRRMTAQ